MEKQYLREEIGRTGLGPLGKTGNAYLIGAASGAEDHPTGRACSISCGNEEPRRLGISGNRPQVALWDPAPGVRVPYQDDYLGRPTEVGPRLGNVRVFRSGLLRNVLQMFLPLYHL